MAFEDWGGRVRFCSAMRFLRIPSQSKAKSQWWSKSSSWRGSPVTYLLTEAAELQVCSDAGTLLVVTVFYHLLKSCEAHKLATWRCEQRLIKEFWPVPGHNSRRHETRLGTDVHRSRLIRLSYLTTAEYRSKLQKEDTDSVTRIL